MRRLKPILPVLCLFAIALLVRVIYNLTVAFDYTPLYDSIAYQDIGFNLLNEHCFCLHPFVKTVYRAPLWPFIIALFAFLFKDGNLSDRLFLCCVDSVTCVLLFLFARDLFGKWIGWVAGLLACIYPALYIYDGWMYTEALYTFLLFATCYCIYRIQRSAGQRQRLWLICGVLLALLTLTRPNGILVSALVVLWALVLFRGTLLRKQVVKNVVLATLVAFLLIVPWTVRNYLVSGAFVPVATGDGTVLLGAYNNEMVEGPHPPGTWLNPLKVTPQLLQPFPLYTCSPSCEVEREDVSKSAALNWIRTHLSLLPQLWLYHLSNFWTPDEHEADMPMYRFFTQPSSQFVLAMARSFPIPIFVLAALGLCVTVRRYWRELLFPYMLILVTLAEAVVYYGIPRFRAPIEPLLILLAAGAIWWLTQKEPGTLRWGLAHRQLQRHTRGKIQGAV